MFVVVAEAGVEADGFPPESLMTSPQVQSMRELGFEEDHIVAALRRSGNSVSGTRTTITT